MLKGLNYAQEMGMRPKLIKSGKRLGPLLKKLKPSIIKGLGVKPPCLVKSLEAKLALPIIKNQ